MTDFEDALAEEAGKRTQELRYDPRSGKPLAVQEPFNSLSMQEMFMHGARWAQWHLTGPDIDTSYLDQKPVARMTILEVAEEALAQVADGDAYGIRAKNSTTIRTRQLLESLARHALDPGGLA